MKVFRNGDNVEENSAPLQKSKKEKVGGEEFFYSSCPSCFQRIILKEGRPYKHDCPEATPKKQ